MILSKKLPSVIDVATDEALQEAFRFWMSPGQAQDLAGCTFSLRMKAKAGFLSAGTVVDLSSYLTASGQILYLDVPNAVVAAWSPADYEFALRIEWPTATDLARLITGIISLSAGI